MNFNETHSRGRRIFIRPPVKMQVAAFETISQKTALNANFKSNASERILRMLMNKCVSMSDACECV